MAISAMLSVNCKISHKAFRILNPALSSLMKTSIVYCGGTFDSKLNIPSEGTAILTNIGLDPTLEVYVYCPQFFFLSGLFHTVMDPNLQFKSHQQTYSHHPPFPSNTRDAKNNESCDSDSYTSSASDSEILERKLWSLQRDLKQEATNVFPSSSKPPGGSPINHPQLKQTSEDPLENLSSFDPDYVPTSDFSSKFDVNTLFNHQIKGENLEFLQKVIQNTIIPTSWTDVPRKMGSPSK
ncbi:hypothetical protein O181_045630 [Austropuccinia psidii MF-1]|uniref:Uncharacterized protein n=1 Tax=Austropuccinia psidii MF-1 TaxID=1389203 RepID=A0A9Q3HLD8_9BASI|nr:hypothetical protein [Austropuccinia psidii MF-1]